MGWDETEERETESETKRGKGWNVEENERDARDVYGREIHKSQTRTMTTNEVSKVSRGETSFD